MQTELTQLIGLHVYTKAGIYVGAIDNVVIEPDACKVDGIYIGDTNPILVDGSKGVVVPFRWIRCIGDVVLLNFFPSSLAPKAPQ